MRSKFLKNRFFVILALTAIVISGGMAAFSILPHSHGKDFSHSKHENCPVYQFGLAHHDTSVTNTLLVGVSFLLLFFIHSKEEVSSSYLLISASQRAPPAS